MISLWQWCLWLLAGGFIFSWGFVFGFASAMGAQDADEEQRARERQETAAVPRLRDRKSVV